MKKKKPQQFLIFHTHVKSKSGWLDQIYINILLAVLHYAPKVWSC